MIIRRFTTSDLSDFLAYQADPVVRRFIPGEPMSQRQAASYLAVQAALDEHAVNAWHAYAVEHAGEQRVIGDVGIWLAEEPPRTGDVGFQFHPGFHGQGYAREAMHAFLPHVFETMDVETVTATCDTPNTASWGLMKRLGMRMVRQSPEQTQFALTHQEFDGATGR
nr:GNAT family N-acetyltransferase [Kineosporia babensis]